MLNQARLTQLTMSIRVREMMEKLMTEMGVKDFCLWLANESGIDEDARLEDIYTVFKAKAAAL